MKRINWKKKLLLWGGIGVLGLIGLFAVNIYLYQRLINEGSRVADVYCLSVNPAIIARKNAFIDGFNVVKNKGRSEDFNHYLDQYYWLDKVYQEKLEFWLGMQREYLDRLDFKYITPKQTQVLADLQFRSREADLNQTILYIKIYEGETPDMHNEFYSRMQEEKQKSVALEEQYNEYWEQSYGYFDIRNYFTYVPESTCPPENWDIPDTDLNEIFKEEVEEDIPVLSPVS